MTSHLLHVSALRCLPRAVIIEKKYINQHSNLDSAMPIGMTKNLKLLRYLKFITINYSIVVLNIKICNKLAQLPVLSFFNVCGVCMQLSISIPIDLKRSLVQVRLTECLIPGGVV